MKRIKNITALASTFTMLILLMGCLKDKYADEGLAGFTVDESAKFVELEGPVTGSPLFAIAYAVNLPFSATDTTANLVTVRIAGDQPVTEDVQVTLDTTQALLDKYNDSLQVGYEVPPSSIYKFPNGLTVTIPKGSREGYLKMTLKSSNLVGHDYAFGFQIKSVSSAAYKLSGNYNNAVVLVGVKNRFDAIYKLRVKMVASDRPTVLTGKAWEWGGEVGTITTGTNTNKLFDYWGFSDYIQPIHTSADAPSGFGSTQPKFTFDLNTNQLTAVTNDYPNPSNGRSFVINSAVSGSKFDPATRNIYAAFIMNQPGFGPLEIYDTLIYVRER